MDGRRISESGGVPFSHDARGELADTTLTTEELARELDALDAQRALLDLSPTSRQRLGRFTVAALILNRTIGTGVFSLPSRILHLTGSSGVSVLLWVVGGLIVLALHLCWLELAMSVPYFSYIDEDGQTKTVAAPRSGGDKNFLEYIYQHPRLLASCIFGVIFVTFGHLAGNAVQFGIFAMQAISPECSEGDECYNTAGVIGWAVAVVTLCAIINVSTRQFAIVLNNIFAAGKVLFVVLIGLLGIIWGSTHGDQCRKISWEGQKEGHPATFADISLALVFSLYPYSGFEQPFYVLAEVRSPKHTFVKATVSAMLLALVIFPLANVGYLCVNPYDGKKPPNMVTAMFETISGASQDPESPDHRTVQAVSALLAVSIAGNIMAQTFAASRVKQEIAKEGILPFSLFFARGSRSWVSKFFEARDRTHFTIHEIEHHPEQVPANATLLHWASEVIFILLFGIILGPDKGYNVLTAIKTATLIGILGLFTSAGLLYLKIDAWIHRKSKNGRQWAKHVQWRPPLSPLHAIVATAAMGLMVFATFAAPSVEISSAPYWVGPATAWAAVAAAVAWWGWLMLDQARKRDFIHVIRRPFLERDRVDGELVVKAEIVVVERIPTRARREINLGLTTVSA